MGKIDSGIERRTLRRADRGDVVVHQRIAVERQPSAQMGQPVGEIEAGVARAGVLARELVYREDVVDAGEAIPKRTESDRYVSLAAKYVVASKSDLEVFGRLKAGLLCEHVRPHGKLMARQRSEVV